MQMTWINLGKSMSSWRKVKELSSIDQSKLDDNRGLTEKLKTWLLEKLKTWLSVKLKTQLPEKFSHLPHKVRRQRSLGADIIQSFRRHPFEGKHTKDFFHTQISNSRSLVK